MFITTGLLRTGLQLGLGTMSNPCSRPQRIKSLLDTKKIHSGLKVSERDMQRGKVTV